MSDEEGLAPPIFKKSAKVKRPTKPRPLLQDDYEEESASQVFRPKKHLTSRIQTISRSAGPTERKSIYSADYLASLRDSTPSTPKAYEQDESRPAHDSVLGDEYDVDGEAGISIPDEGTIRHLKEKRELRRHAGENYIPLSDALSMTRRERGDTARRIQTEDAVDDMGGDGTEGLQGYESDSLPLGTRNQARADREKKAEMQSLILERHGELDDPYLQDSAGPGVTSADSSDSDDEWERTQVRKSAVPQSARDAEAPQNRAAVMPEIRPVLTISQLQQKIKRHLEAATQLVESKRAALAQLEKEQIEIADQEEAIKSGLQRANLAYETARLKIGGLETFSRLDSGTT